MSKEYTILVNNGDTGELIGALTLSTYLPKHLTIDLVGSKEMIVYKKEETDETTNKKKTE